MAQPLTTSDSIYSFDTCLSDATPGSKFLVDRTQTYEAADEQTIQWWGKPGFIDPDYYTNFWMPLPEHAWGEFPPEELLRDWMLSTRLPLGWGPYIIDEWEAGTAATFYQEPQLLPCRKRTCQDSMN